MKKQSNVSKQRILFLKQISALLKSGMPLLKGLQILGKNSNPAMNLLCYRLQQQLGRGTSLAEAMEIEKRIFPVLVRSLVRAGEESGSLTQILDELTAYYEKQDKLKGYIIQVSVYPLFLLGLTVIVGIFFLFYILPFIANAYVSLGVQPKGMLAAALAVQAYLSANLLLIACILCLLVFALVSMRNEIVCLVQKLLWQLFPYRLIYEIRFCKLIALLLESGLSITHAVALAEEAADNYHCQKELALLNMRIRKGMDIVTASTGAGKLFSQVTLDFINVGATTGCLPQMLLEAAILGEEILEAKMNGIKSILAPLLLLAVALVVAVLICSIIGPLLEMVSVLPE